MATPITFSGLASGLDTASIIKGLVSIERRPIDVKNSRRDRLNANLGLFSKIGEKLSALRDSADKLRNAANFSSLKATSGDTNIVTTEATGSASAGTYQVEITQLASRETETSQSYANFDTLKVGTGTLHVTVGSTTKNIAIVSGSDTLGAVRDSINAADAGVSASIVNDGSGYLLVITANDGGLAHAVTLDATGLTGGDQALSFTQTAAPADAIFSVNGIVVHRDSNHVNDIVDGLTFDLVRKTAANSPITVRVDADVEGLKGDLKEFVKAYNDVQNLLHGQLSFTAGQAAPALLGDSTLVRIQSGLSSTVNKAVDAPEGAPQSLSAIGIRTSADGTLSIDDKKLEDAIKANPDGIVHIFTDGAGGLAGTLEDFATSIVRSSDGLLGARTDSIQRQVRQLGDSIRRDEARVAVFEQSQRRRFAALESLLGKLQAQSASLGSLQRG